MVFHLFFGGTTCVQTDTQHQYQVVWDLLERGVPLRKGGIGWISEGNAKPLPCFFVECTPCLVFSDCHKRLSKFCG